jgi:REP element-mobilizing transposase RayT
MSATDTILKLLPAACYHIYNRGNNKETLFKESKNYNYFLSLWKKYIEPVAETYCYNLLPNHFHFFIRTRTTRLYSNNTEILKSENYSKAFADLFNAYAKAINNQYNRSGSLFQER